MEVIIIVVACLLTIGTIWAIYECIHEDNGEPHFADVYLYG
jgi:hypothetical protein